MRRRWSRASWVYLAGSIVSAVLAGLLVQSYVQNLEARAGAIGAAVPVVVTSTDVARGTQISAQQLSVVQMPKAFIPPRPLSRISQAAGRVALGDLLKGEVVTDHRLARVRAGPVASLVPEGLRAFAVPTSLPPRAVRPGDHVDVLATFATGQPHTEVVVTGVEVLFVLHGGAGVGPEVSESGFDAASGGGAASTTLILLVAPEQEQSLAFARAFANLEVAIAPSGEAGLMGA